MASSPSVTTFTIYEDFNLHAKVYDNGESSKIMIALHGWMDNVETFHYLGPAMAAAGFKFIAVDLAGHGHSSHLPSCSYYSIMNYSADIVNLIRTHFTEKDIYLVGHSMGGGISTIVSATLSDQVRGVCLIDNLGIPYRAESNCVNFFNECVTGSAGIVAQGLRSNSIYDNLDGLVSKRITTPSKYPGNQYISSESAELLIKGAVEVVDAGFRLTHDRRIALPALIQPSNEHAVHILEAIKCPIHIVAAEDGFPYQQLPYAPARFAALEKNPKFSFETLPGSHHLHLDPKSAPAAVDAIVRFFISI